MQALQCRYQREDSMAAPQRPGQTTPQASPPAADTQPRAATPEESRKELQEAIRGSRQVLATATTALSIFPDTLVVDRAKLTVTKRTFFSTAEVMSRIMNTEKPYIIGRFWRGDALHLKRVTQGYIIALQRHIDCSSLPTQELATMLDKLGEDDH